ncbi:1-deoxy-D-xylulose-5-phosphate synthase, partial [Candidatus Poribacteria bacterium]|nr:1-deoxy-D-xylulose-5-phosphate synthase [Candidatus Poribacteria bacterium]
MSHSHAEPLPSFPSGKALIETGTEMRATASPILPTIGCAADVRALDVASLSQLAGEVRQRIIEVIADKGGHFGAPLGAVDIAIALLHQFDVPRDKVVWDVGHQAYAWKILTGRNERFDTIRQYGGLSGFLKRKESACDAFGAGHASTSISAALGMALARDRNGGDFRVAAVIGDGAMTGGMAYEALNNAGLRKTRMLVVFNDNEMSISKNVWVVHEMFRKAVTHPLYARLRRDVVGMIKRHTSDTFIEYAHRFEEALKGMIVPGMFFEELGFRYIGPIDGHNIGAMVETLQKIKELPGPICLHVITQKGKGYKFAENDPIKYHAAANMKIETGVMAKKEGPPALTKIFGDALTKLGHENPDIVGVTAAMDSGTGLDIWAKAFPERFYDVGIAEECAVTMAAGMASEGLRPVCAIYSTFLQRAFDQIVHDVALQELPVFFVLDRGGLVGADGPTHHGVFDLSYLRIIPNMVVMAPKDEVELCHMVRTGVEYTEGPIAMRYPRGTGSGLALPEHFET